MLSQILQNSINSLSLNEFPVSKGNWRNDASIHNKSFEKKLNPDSYFSVTLKDGDANTFKTEELIELISSEKSIWHKDYNFCAEATDIKSAATLYPWNVSDKHIQLLIKTLRLVDKNISEIDPEIAKLKNLKSLILNANQISEFNFAYLPKSLEVLELFANQMNNLDSLIAQPQIHLNHLGVGRNKISHLRDCFTPERWTNLISLDLSYNLLTDLLEIGTNLAKLPKLRYLLLVGNPISLCPGYRGYIIDNNKRLDHFDDILVSADERHNFRGISTIRKDFVKEETKLQIKVAKIINLPIPDEQLSPADFPEFPMIVRKYFVRFWIPYEQKKASTKVSFDDNLNAEQTGNPESPSEELKAAPDQQQSAVIVRDETTGIDWASVDSSCIDYRAGEIEVNWQETIRRHDLITMHSFYGSSLRIEVIEEKRLLYPPDQVPAKPDASSDNGNSKAAGSKPKKSVAGGGVPDGAAPKKDDGAKKKKKLDEASLVVFDRQLTTLAEFQLSDVSRFLRGKFHIHRTIKTSHGIRSTPASSPDLIRANHLRQSSPPRDGSRKHGNNTNRDRKKSIQINTKGKSSPKAGGGGGKKPDTSATEKEVETPEPVPLSLELCLELIHWKNIKDSIDDGELEQIKASSS